MLYLLFLNPLFRNALVDEVFDLHQRVSRSPCCQCKEDHALFIGRQHSECCVIRCEIVISAADRQTTGNDLTGTHNHRSTECLCLFLIRRKTEALHRFDAKLLRNRFDRQRFQQGTTLWYTHCGFDNGDISACDRPLPRGCIAFAL
ncbi:MAG: hypothetical protein J5722_05350 [Oscillospiraceae bacterium]|nr:hypothetical protein [Oscillospiraceae bacterium]